MKRIIIVLTAVLFTITVMGQNQQDAAAQQGLNNFKQLLKAMPSKENDSLRREAGNLTLGRPVTTAIIPLDRLKKYTRGQSASEFIIDIDKVIYPVINSRTKTAVSTITVERTNNKWAPTAYGAEKRNAEQMFSLAANLSDYKLVKIIALNLSFISTRKDNSIQFIPLQDDRQRDIIQGRPVAAERILDIYVKAANDYNGLPL